MVCSLGVLTGVFPWVRKGLTGLLPWVLTGLFPWVRKGLTGLVPWILNGLLPGVRKGLTGLFPWVLTGLLPWVRKGNQSDRFLPRRGNLQHLIFPLINYAKNRRNIYLSKFRMDDGKGEYPWKIILHYITQNE